MLTDAEPPGKTGDNRPAARAERLRAELRANLLKRKGRTAPEGAEQPPPPTNPR